MVSGPSRTDQRQGPQRGHELGWHARRRAPAALADPAARRRVGRLLAGLPTRGGSGPGLRPPHRLDLHRLPRARARPDHPRRRPAGRTRPRRSARVPAAALHRSRRGRHARRQPVGRRHPTAPRRPCPRPDQRHRSHLARRNSDRRAQSRSPAARGRSGMLAERLRRRSPPRPRRRRPSHG